jgi:hypothetical protein
MNKLFEIASTLKTPLALGGVVVIAMFLIYKAILKKKIFPRLTKIHSYKLINKIVDDLFFLAIFAMLIGFIGYIYVYVAPSRTSIEQSESIKLPSLEKLVPSETLTIELEPPKFPSPSEKQKYASTAVNKDFSVIHFTVEEKEPFPIIKFTLMNGTENTQVITKLKVTIHEFGTGIAEYIPLVLKPLAVWDVKLPYSKGIFNYKPASPILIPSDNAASINLRLFHSEIEGPDSPHRASYYTLRFVFICARGFEAETPFFILWDEDVLTE